MESACWGLFEQWRLKITHTKFFNKTFTLGTIKASQVVVLNEDMKLLLNENLWKQRDPHPQIEFDFVEKHIH